MEKGDAIRIESAKNGWIISDPFREPGTVSQPTMEKLVFNDMDDLTRFIAEHFTKPELEKWQNS